MRKRHGAVRRVVLAGLAVCAGAAVEYLCDPDRGRSRRARARAKGVRAARLATGGLGVVARDAANRARGLAGATRYRVAGRRADDRILYERVRAELGRYVRHPHAVEVVVQDGTVRLGGDVLAREARPARRALRRIPGVREVEPHWNVHGSAETVPRLPDVSRTRGLMEERERPRGTVAGRIPERWSPSGRLAAAVAALSAWPLSARLPGPLAWAARAAGAVLLARAATNLPLRRLTGVHAGGRAVDVTRGIAIEASAEEIWPLVSDYSVLARIMPGVREIRRSADGRTTHWAVSGPAGVPVRFEAAETRREDGREIAWRTTEGRLVSHAGVLRLVPETGGRTRVEVRLAYNPLAGATGHAVACLLGADPGTRLRDGLLRLRGHVESGTQPVRSG